jgi:hypothetical protein
MKSKLETTPPTSPRGLEEQRLKREAVGFFAPSKNKTLFENRAEQYVRKGLEQFDAQQEEIPDTLVLK